MIHNRRKKSWWPALLLSGALWASVPFARLWSEALRERGLLRGSLLVLTFVLLAAFAYQVRDQAKQWTNITWIGLVSVFIAYIALFVLAAAHPEEGIHILQVTCLAFLFLRAQHSPLIAGLLASFVGMIEETLQLFVPMRVFDWRDFGMNFVAGLLSIILLKLLERRPSKMILLLGLLLVGGSAEAKLVRSEKDLKFFELTSFDRPSKYLGFSSSKLDNVVEVPMSDTWYVRPDKSMTHEEYVSLIAEVKTQKYAGLDVSDRWDVTDQTLHTLEGAAALKILRLSNTKITDKGLGFLETLSSLEVLALSNQTTDVGLKHVTPLRRLKALELRRTKITNAGLSALKNLPALSVLDLSETRVTDAGAKTLSAIESLKQLDISGTQITDHGLSYLKALPRLEVFYASGHMTNKGLESISELKRLRSLDVSGSAITNEGLRALARMKKLEALALSDTAIDDRGMEAVSQIRSLKVLEISGTRVTREGLAYLAQLPKLETLSVSWTELSSAELAVLYDVRSLQSVILNGRTVDREKFARIQAIAKRTHQKKMTRPEIVTKPITTPTPKVATQPSTAQPKTAPKHVFARTTKETRTMPVSSFAPSSPMGSPQAIPMGDPAGEGMIIEVKAGPSRAEAGSPKRLRGLKRLHQIEMAQTPQELTLEDGDSKPVIGSQEPKTSLGEITINAR